MVVGRVGSRWCHFEVMLNRSCQLSHSQVFDDRPVEFFAYDSFPVAS